MTQVQLERSEGTLFRFATAGSVDDGKSTLVGRLLHDSKAILADQLDTVTRTSTERGFGGAAGGIDFALLTDGLRAEREQGITIDVAYRYFATDQRSFILADCPGHVQYTRNMVTGATTADAVIMLIDARKGVLEQTRRHLSVVKLLRVPHIVIAVNKIDLQDYDEAAFGAVAAAVRRVTDELGLGAVHVIPVSALVGDNVVERSPNTPWYDGPSLLELLETLPAADDVATNVESFRLPVQLVLRPQGAVAVAPEDAADYRDYRAYAGQVASGTVRVGDTVTVTPGGASTVVTGIDFAGIALDEAVAPQSVALRLRDDLDIARGAVIGTAGTMPEPVKELAADLFWLDPRALQPGARVLVKFGTHTVQAIVGTITGRLNLDTLDLEVAPALEINDIGQVTVRLSAALPVETYAANRRAGAFLVIQPQDGATLAAGIVTAAGTNARTVAGTAAGTGGQA
ncbi:sulfate adenylyltransferase [Cryobacterium sp. LW097]|uniref:sulfate adenylyltransferase subunit 1 n=1 Tax=unclassified Cryobacterium TaxID=2649013 RepID=UPI000B4C356E|nr:MULTISPECIES: GTP-binding protein [unclassified Cryobacterium]ASD22431.1 sulfate adenylyltransferase [Cryobacterium sp. LW097]TFC58116.1 sulfate adenylyltransferase [Cryobacterium sp. TMB3-1-2]TFC71223.1 sulfate adenylyltransferase [Cryobacterium sp. TMB3-15]TFC79334.1 sulfate adenylyltransferase [Cryobacterium sp. TMB3-10]TFC90297.1 sulfate adenylyltransferase [Cryobacterium sp. TMT4-31]